MFYPKNQFNSTSNNHPLEYKFIGQPLFACSAELDEIFNCNDKPIIIAHATDDENPLHITFYVLFSCDSPFFQFVLSWMSLDNWMEENQIDLDKNI